MKKFNVGEQSTTREFTDRVRNISHKVDTMNINDNSPCTNIDLYGIDKNLNILDSNDDGGDMPDVGLADADDNVFQSMNDKTQGDTLNQIKALRPKRTKILQDQRYVSMLCLSLVLCWRQKCLLRSQKHK